MLKICDYVAVFRKHSNAKMALFTLFLMFWIYLVIAHMMGCVYIFIGRHEAGLGSRYDRQTLFDNLSDRNFVTLQPALEMS
jgi:hypothetical protein